MNKQSDYLVDVVMVTYNQEQYIAQAIESVLMQKTVFPFRLIIGEDCSTDNTRKICITYAEKYPETIKLILHNENQGLLKNYKSVFDACTAKYLAVLEGDDYWIDEFKLQKQVEILENDITVGLVHAKFYVLTSGRLKIYKAPKYARKKGEIYNELIKSNYIGPLTVLFRKELLDRHVNFSHMISENYSTIDYALWLEFSYNSRIEYLNETVAVYRKEKGSVSVPMEFSKVEIFNNTIIKIIEYFENKYLTDKNAISDAYHFMYYGLMLKSIHFNAFDRTQFYLSKCKPISLMEHIKCIIARRLWTIKVAKFLHILK